MQQLRYCTSGEAPRERLANHTPPCPLAQRSTAACHSLFITLWLYSSSGCSVTDRGFCTETCPGKNPCQGLAIDHRSSAISHMQPRLSGRQVGVHIHTTRRSSHDQHHTVSPLVAPAGHPILQFATRLQLREQKLLQYRRTSKLGVEQNATKNSQSIYRASVAADDYELQKVRKALPPLLQESRSEPSYPATVSIGSSGSGQVGWAAAACDLHMTDLGGNCGREPTAWGNVCTSFW
jgi:hypothetical protein